MEHDVNKEEIDADIFELAEKYISKLSRLAEEAIIAINDQNFEAAFSIAHSLKGSSGSYGFIGLYKLAVKLEDCLQKNQWESSKIVVEDIQKYYLHLEMIPREVEY